MPSEPVRSVALGNLRAELHQCTSTGLMTWLSLRPVLLGSERAALLLLHGRRTDPSTMLQVIGQHVKLLAIEQRGQGYMLGYIAWPDRERALRLLVDLLGAPRGTAGMPPAADVAGTGPGTLPSLTGEGHSASANDSAILRYSQTPEGQAARARLVEFTNATPTFLDLIAPRRWELPHAITMSESARLRRVLWRLEFGSGVEVFWDMSSRLRAPLRLAHEDDEKAEGISVLECATVAAPAGDMQARKQFAAFLWELLHRVWASGREARPTTGSMPAELGS